MRALRDARAIALATAVVVLSAGQGEGADGSALALALEDLEGRPAELSLRDGDVAVVAHFWATWCPTCVEELALIDEAARACRHDVRVVAVNVAEEVAKIREFLTAHEIRLPQLRDPSGDAWRAISSRGLPVNLIWTSQGQRVESGPKDAKGWKQTLSEVGCVAKL
jgi:thiol-disulfide isomerase/thioredoxin